MARGDSGYPDPGTGLFVLTAAFLADRGICCESGCRHCPYVSDGQDQYRDRPGRAPGGPDGWPMVPAKLPSGEE